MPETSKMNGYAKTNGHSFDMEDGSMFLFTSESVGEGHPGQFSSNLSEQKCAIRKMAASDMCVDFARLRNLLLNRLCSSSSEKAWFYCQNVRLKPKSKWSVGK